MILPCLVIRTNFFIPLLDLSCLVKNLLILKFPDFILDASIITLQDCFCAFFKICSSEFVFTDLGDFTSNFIPSIYKSAVFILDLGINSTLCPAIAKIFATRNSCGHGLQPAGIIILPFVFLLLILFITKNASMNNLQIASTSLNKFALFSEFDIIKTERGKC